MLSIKSNLIWIRFLLRFSVIYHWMIIQFLASQFVSGQVRLQLPVSVFPCLDHLQVHWLMNANKATCTPIDTCDTSLCQANANQSMHSNREPDRHVMRVYGLWSKLSFVSDRMLVHLHDNFELGHPHRLFSSHYLGEQVLNMRSAHAQFPCHLFSEQYVAYCFRLLCLKGSKRRIVHQTRFICIRTLPVPSASDMHLNMIDVHASDTSVRPSWSDNEHTYNANDDTTSDTMVNHLHAKHDQTFTLGSFGPSLIKSNRKQIKFTANISTLDYHDPNDNDDDNHNDTGSDNDDDDGSDDDYLHLASAKQIRLSCDCNHNWLISAHPSYVWIRVSTCKSNHSSSSSSMSVPSGDPIKSIAFRACTLHLNVSDTPTRISMRIHRQLHLPDLTTHTSPTSINSHRKHDQQYQNRIVVTDGNYSFSPQIPLSNINYRHLLVNDRLTFYTSSIGSEFLIKLKIYANDQIKSSYSSSNAFVHASSPSTSTSPPTSTSIELCWQTLIEINKVQFSIITLILICVFGSIIALIKPNGNQSNLNAISAINLIGSISHCFQHKFGLFGTGSDRHVKSCSMQSELLQMAIRCQHGADVRININDDLNARDHEQNANSDQPEVVVRASNRKPTSQLSLALSEHSLELDYYDYLTPFVPSVPAQLCNLNSDANPPSDAFVRPSHI